MKMLNIIFSIYLVVLSCLPCADKLADSLAHQAEIHSTTDAEHSHDVDNDLCSPFCVCSCCGFHTLTYVAVVPTLVTVLFEEIKSSHSFYTSIASSNFFGSIWQPPQIA
ncbi:DUF6660 family protein [Flavobacterium sp. NG2]|uniref:DUF6660 family protein n=1 Tax=Flavobacterium sp. NG2 TaxID=3097547 RepID=UPI002A7F0D2A|nr:DUF6660 family protein [Flavobacterium sp. NG2]WPR71215.1 DUF6660 family protein [Flavobacterium sp. NG2]